MSIRTDALNAAKEAYRKGVALGARKFEAVADKLPDYFVDGLRNRFGSAPRTDVVERYRVKVPVMKQKYAAYASNPDADKWAKRWVKGLFGIDL